jgi:hypothetical protein
MNCNALKSGRNIRFAHSRAQPERSTQMDTQTRSRPGVTSPAVRASIAP